MHFFFDRFLFKLPDDLRDQTVHVFERREIKESLAITYEPPPGPGGLEALAREIVDRLRLLDPEADVSVTSPLRLAIGDALVVRGHVVLPKTGRLRCQVAVVDVGGELTVRAIHRCSPQAAPAWFEPMLQSLSDVLPPWPPPPPGSARRVAGALSLLLPAEFRPPDAALLAGGGITVRFASIGERGLEPPRAAAVATAGPGQTVVTDQVEPPVPSALGGEPAMERVATYTLRDASRAAVESFAVRLIWAPGPEGGGVAVRAQAPGPAWGRLAALWTSLIAGAELVP